MARGFFVTGTDTGVGKTRVAAALVHAFARRGLRVAGMKPIASGAAATADGLRNDDALALMREATVELPYELVNPVCLEPAIAPHLAAAELGLTLTLEPLVAAYSRIAAASDVVVVEGAGGWLVPLGPGTTFAEIPRALHLDVVLVVGLRLGCINHALLSAQAIAASGCRMVGWVGSAIDPAMPRRDANVATLRERLPMPCLGVLPFEPGATAAQAAAHLELAPR